MPAPQVQVLLRVNAGGGGAAYIGNPLFGGDTRDFTDAVAAHGVGLVSTLLEDTHLGRIRHVGQEEEEHLPRQSGYEDAAVAYLWKCVEADPLDLYDRTRSGEI
jgi:hypothetical protein